MFSLVRRIFSLYNERNYIISSIQILGFVADLRSLVRMVSRDNESHWLLETLALGGGAPASGFLFCDGQGPARYPGYLFF